MGRRKRLGGLSTGTLMHVGLIIYGDLETLTGGYLYDRELVAYLKEKGDEVEVISLPWRNYIRHLGDNFSRRLLHRLTAVKFDILIQDELNHPSLFLMNRWLKNRVSYPIVALVHLLRSSEPHPLGQKRIYGALERQYFETVDGAVFNCQTTRTAVEQLSRQSVPGVVAYPGRHRSYDEVSLEEVAKRAQRPGPLRIIFLANVVPGKGLHTLIEALSQLTPGSWRLMVVGNLTMASAYSDRIRNQIARAGLTDYVDLVGAVPNEEVPDYLAKNHILVGPSRYEALGIVYLEAMGCGLPLIATAAGGAHEIVAHGVTGFLTPPDEPNSLAQHLRHLDQNRDQLFEMSLAAYQSIHKHPTWDQSMARVRDFLQSLDRNRERHSQVQSPVQPMLSG
jgi:glycosyltransferase involved in cell wall biosynthesis